MIQKVDVFVVNLVLPPLELFDIYVQGSIGLGTNPAEIFSGVSGSGSLDALPQDLHFIKQHVRQYATKAHDRTGPHIICLALCICIQKMHNQGVYLDKLSVRNLKVINTFFFKIN